ncbi:MAG: TonB C-terminal domain-containing protein [Thermodesulfovibrionales bacterium]|nr:TonB C-terminal domain-containing protein [Thermodesulfovibrionales bacterium]
MRAPGLKKAAGVSFAVSVAISFIVHIGLLSLTAVAVRQRAFEMPPAYTVTLIAPEEDTAPPVAPPAPHEAKTEDTVKAASLKEAEKDLSKKAVVNTPHYEADYRESRIKALMKKQSERQHKEDMLSVIRAKKEVGERVRAKQEISIGADAAGAGGGPRSTDPVSLYVGRLDSEIERLWYFPDTGGAKKDGLRAVVHITLMRNGDVRVDKIESSGNSLFDDSAIRVFKRLSFFERPPEEMEIVVNFTDEGLK